MDIKITTYRVRDFISWQKNGTLELSPKFQRRPVWKPGAKSFLIDTILRGLPVPIIFLREKIGDISDLEPSREVVDGQQRLRTIFSFIRPSLLKDFDSSRDSFLVSEKHNKHFCKKQFSNLPEDIQRSILDYTFSVHVLPAGVDDREVLQIFSRMNSTGVKLNNQELRNAEFIGEMKTSIYNSSIGQLYKWRDWKVFTENSISRMEEVELVSEIYQFMLDGIVSKSQKSLNTMYHEYEEEFKDRDEAEKRFNMIMDLIDDELGKDISETIFSLPKYFFLLYCYIYQNIFGFGELTEKRKPTKSKAKIKNSLVAITKDVEEERLDKSLLELIQKRRLTTEEFRVKFLRYMQKRF